MALATYAPAQTYTAAKVQFSQPGLDPAAKAAFDRGFLMKSGSLYDPAYAQNFLTNNSALQALSGYAATYKAYADPNTHLVDLVMTFAKVHR